MNTIHLEVLPDNTKETFFLLKKLPSIEQFFLAGGTGTALYLGHRLSGDLDFFTPKTFNESLLIQKLARIATFRLEKKSEHTVIGILKNTKVSFFSYEYPLLFKTKNVSGIMTADIIDIACMKIDAISARGAKRDFIDIYFIAKDIVPLEKILEFFKKKYVSIHYNMAHVKKSLVFFKDAEREPMPNMLKPANWSEIKTFFQKEIKEMSSQTQNSR